MSNDYSWILQSKDTTFGEKYNQLLGASPYAKEMSDIDRAIAAKFPEVGIELLLNKESWHAAGDPAVRAALHERNSLLREDFTNPPKTGYAYLPGGIGGTGSRPKASGSESAWSVSGALSGAAQKSLPSAKSAESYIEAMYRAQEEANLQALKSAYDANINAVNNAKSQVPLGFDAARSKLATENEIGKASFGEYAAARGLGSGADAQMRLSMENTLLGGLSELSAGEAAKMADLEFQLAELERKYHDDIAYEIAKGNYAKAKALYDDFVRVDNSFVEAAYRSGK